MEQDLQPCRSHWAGAETCVERKGRRGKDGQEGEERETAVYRRSPGPGEGMRQSWRPPEAPLAASPRGPAEQLQREPR